MISKSKSRFLAIYFIIFISFLFSTLVLSQSNSDKAIVLQIDGAIGPATSNYIEKGLHLAATKQAKIVIIELDTPGGLDVAMRDIIRNIIASPVPVAIYVSPPGARAASAGTYMMYASHIAAMAPGTNLGAATPVQIGGIPDIGMPNSDENDSNNDSENGEEEPALSDPMTSKMVNDAVAYIRSLAEMRGRNVEWAEEAVRKASSLSSNQALEKNVIDFIATDIHDLLNKINGKTVKVNEKEILLETSDVELEFVTPDWRNKLLSVITNPNIAYILMLLAMYGLFFELANPGYVLPGVIGAISLLLALYSMQLLPVNYAGLGLIFLGIIFMISETLVPSFGVLGIGGMVAFIVGSIILFDIDGGGIAISIPVILSISLLTTGFFYFVVHSSVKAFKRPVVSGKEQMIGSIGEVLEDFEESGHIFIHGETWRASADAIMHKGEKVIVTGINGLILKITPVEEKVK